MKRGLITILAILLVLLNYQEISAQGEIDEQKRILYRNERTFGLFLNSNGYGGDFSFANRINARNQTIYQVEVLYLKHPKEIKLSNSFYSNKSFVFGKTNSFFELRGQWGRSSEIFRKNDAGGVSIRYFYSIGPTIGFLKPIYYEILYQTGVPYEFYTKVEKFNTSIHQSNIFGKASFFEGFDEISIIPGASAKVGFTFEYSRRDVNINALEIGAGIDIFPKEIPIMATETNQFFFLNLFVGYRFGKAIDISDAARAQRRTFSEIMEERRRSRQIIKEQRRAAREQDEY
ncbi:MAG: hypothetical protein ACP5E3_16565 [Bacteroidales bacterium]